MARRPRKPKAAETLVETGGEAPPVAVEGDFNGADPKAFDHDGDGHAGGSKPRSPEERSEVQSGRAGEALSSPPGDDPSSPGSAEGGRGRDGSLVRRLGEHELSAICAEAFESYDYQDQRIRFDSRGRKWTFRPEKVPPGNSVLSLSVERLDVRHEDTISTALLASEMGRDMVCDVVAKLADRLA